MGAADVSLLTGSRSYSDHAVVAVLGVLGDPTLAARMGPVFASASGIVVEERSAPLPRPRVVLGVTPQENQLHSHRSTSRWHAPAPHVGRPAFPALYGVAPGRLAAHLLMPRGSEKESP